MSKSSIKQKNSEQKNNGLIENFRDCLPLEEGIVPVSLSEGFTPLIRLHNLPKAWGLPTNTYVKYEGLNPTGSFKDRGMTVAVTHAKGEGKNAVICASTGNTSASAAAYAARAGMRSFVLIPEGKVAAGKMAQAIIEGAIIIRIRGNFDHGMEIVKDLAPRLGLAIVNSINPYRLQGQKTAALEIIEILGRAPDYHCLPVGNAGNISAYWMGYSEAAGRAGYCSENESARLPLYRNAPHSVSSAPVMVGYQAEGAAPIVNGAPVENPETVATAIRIGNPQSWKMATASADESGGWFRTCSDDEILAAQRALAQNEGVFCEPASAASIAGLAKDAKDGKIAKDALVVCTLTGNGLKDPDIAAGGSDAIDRVVDAGADQVSELIKSNL